MEKSLPRSRFLREVSLHVSGTGWRAYDQVVGQPVFYPGFSENMMAAVLSTPILQKRITQLAEKRIAVEEKEGLLKKDDPLYAAKKSQRKSVIEHDLNELCEKMTDDMICKMESKPFIRGAYYFATQLLTRAYHQGIHVSSEEVLRLREVAKEAEKKKQSIIFLPCHRSHVDYVSMQLICYRLGMTLPTVVAGDNLNFPLVGSFLQHAGTLPLSSCIIVVTLIGNRRLVYSKKFRRRCALYDFSPVLYRHLTAGRLQF